MNVYSDPWLIAANAAILADRADCADREAGRQATDDIREAAKLRDIPASCICGWRYYYGSAVGGHFKPTRFAAGCPWHTRERRRRP